MKHLLKLMDLSEQEINDILNLADQLKYEKKNGIKHHILEGKTLGLIFSKASTRTRVSFASERVRAKTATSFRAFGFFVAIREAKSRSQNRQNASLARKSSRSTASVP